jgi:hypothetical protein
VHRQLAEVWHRHRRQDANDDHHDHDLEKRKTVPYAAYDSLSMAPGEIPDHVSVSTLLADDGSGS